MRKMSSIALVLALLAAPAALAGEKAGCCAKKSTETAGATCEKSKKETCTAEEKAKCAEKCAAKKDGAKAEAPKTPKS